MKQFGHEAVTLLFDHRERGLDLDHDNDALGRHKNIDKTRQTFVSHYPGDVHHLFDPVLYRRLLICTSHDNETTLFRISI